MSSLLSSHHGRVAALSRSRRPDDPSLVDAQRSLRAAKLADYIKRTIDAAPPLTIEQRDELALQLRGDVA